MWMLGFTPFSSIFLFVLFFIILGSSNGMIKFKMTFQIGFKNGGYVLAPSLKSFILKSNLLMIISKSVLGD